ncbi:uncharacterized protein VTP21DRAFT_6474 [Calcarisporiella thermophila]|uniref:uncharacterized protein n=1 Tax=Calcarisporiella thermophila TaxID=911321 RepID=UPI00374301E3
MEPWSRRTTLGPESGIPVPSTARRTTIALESNAFKSSIPPPPSAGRTTVTRPSMMSVRRSSAFHRPSSVGIVNSIGSGGTPSKDPRPVRDKSFQHKAIRNIINFLAQSGYTQAVSTKTLSQPTLKDFQNIFKFLYAKLDPHYVFQKKFEEEVPALLKGIKYPFADQISRSSLYAVGSMHSWPIILAMLDWMVQLIMSVEKIDPKINEMNFDDSPEKIFFDYLAKAYGYWMDVGNNDFDEMEQELAARFDRKNEHTIQEIERLQKESQSLLAELQQMNETESPLVQLDKERATLQSDKEKFLQYIKKLQGRKQKLTEVNEELKNELKISESELERLDSEKNEVQAKVDSQEVSPADVDRMTVEREQLMKSLNEVAVKSEELNKQIWEKEREFQSKLSMVDRAVQRYNEIAYSICLIPSSAANAGGGDYELALDTNAIGSEQMISVDLRNAVKPILQKLRVNFNTALHKTQEESFHLQDIVDRLSEQVSDKVEELSRLEGRVRHLTQQYTEEREVVAAENAASNQEIEALEQELQRMRIDGATTLLQSQQKVQKVTIEYDVLLRQANELREMATQEIIQILEDLIKFKAHVEGSLRQLEQLAVKEQQNTLEQIAVARKEIDAGR